MKFRSHGSDYSAPPRNTPDAPDPIAMLILMVFPRVSCRLVIPVSSALNRREPSVKKSELLRALQQEIRRHDFISSMSRLQSRKAEKAWLCRGARPARR